VGSDGAIIGIPCNADSVLRVDPADDSVTLHGKGVVRTGHHRDDGKYKFLGGVLGSDGRVYCIPSDSDYVLRVGPGKDPVVENIGRTLAHEKWQQNKWQNGFLGADGCIYGIPLKAENVLCINCATGAVSTIGGPFAGHNKWEGGVVAPDGAMYCMPLKAHYVMKIMPSDPQAEAEQTRARSTALACALLALGTAVAKG